MALIGWTPNGVVENADAPGAPPHIRISCLDEQPKFRGRALLALDLIYDRPPGRTLLEGFIQLYDDTHRVLIAYGDGNQCECFSDAMFTALARSALNGEAGFAAHLTAALAELALNDAAGHAVVAERMNAVPRYSLGGPIAADPGNYGVVAAHVGEWAAGGGAAFPAPLPQDDLDFIRNALLVALQQGQQAGAGASSRVRWDPEKRKIRIGDDEIWRAPFIGLAHELIHAWNNLRGRQIGRDFSHPSTVLYEFMCVGLGPWALPPGAQPQDANLPISENGIRMSWDTDLRERYG